MKYKTSIQDRPLKNKSKTLAAKLEESHRLKNIEHDGESFRAKTEEEETPDDQWNKKMKWEGKNDLE